MRLRTIAAAAAVLLGLVATPSPASAHEATARHGRDWAITDHTHRSGMVCDEERDGHAAYAVWDIAYPYGTRAEVDSTDPGCDTPPLFPDIAIYFKLCERRPGPDSCTRWVWT